MTIPEGMTPLLPFVGTPPQESLAGEYGYYYAEIRDGEPIVSGWALIPMDGGYRLPERLLVTAGERILGYGMPLIPRPDVMAAKEGQAPLSSGFAFHLGLYKDPLEIIRVWILDNGKRLPLNAQFVVQEISSEQLNSMDEDLRNLLYVDKLNCIVFGLTAQCNLKCVYCTGRAREEMQEMSDPDRQLTWDDNFVEELALATRSVALVGIGEPTMRKGWQNIFKRIKDKNIILTVTTNFSRKFSPSDFAALALVDRLGISLDTPDQTILGATRVNADVDLIINNIITLRKTAQAMGKRQKIAFCAVVSDRSATTLPELAELCIRLDLEGINFMSLALPSELRHKGVQLRPLSELPPAENAPFVEKLRTAVKLLKNNHKVCTLFPDLEALLNALDSSRLLHASGCVTTQILETQTRKCPFVWQELNFLGGRVSPCCVLASGIMYKQAFPLQQMINHPFILQLRLELLTGNLNATCQRCNIADAISIPEYRAFVLKLKSGQHDNL